MRIAFFDAFSGIAGDMTVAALIDAGVPLAAVEEAVARLGLDGLRLELGRRRRSGIAARSFSVRTSVESPPHRRYREIRDRLAASPLAEGVRSRALRIFRALAAAEGRVHGIPADEVSFHEVGAIDAIVDVVAVAVCLERLDVGEVYVSSLPAGSGLVASAHGAIPVPAPAVVELLRGFRLRPEDGSAELVTPTGAAIIAALATPGPPPEMIPEATGYGAGERELDDRPNLLRVLIGRRPPPPRRLPLPSAPTLAVEADEMVVLEANIDDMNPQLFEPAIEALFEAGARDVTLTPITMKKGRPGVLLRAIVSADDRERVAARLLGETSTIGLRSYPVSRLTLRRRVRTVETEFGSVLLKVVTLPDGGERAAPEYEDCRRVARARGVSVAEVHAAALRAAGRAE